MINKYFLCFFIPFSFIGTLLVNYYFPYPTLWILFLIPAVSAVVLIPKWKVVLLVGLLVSAVKVVMQLMLYSKGLSIFANPYSLVVSEIVWWILLLFISNLKITNRRLVLELEEISVTDPLTKTYNRRFLNLYMEKALTLDNSGDNPLLILIMDIDHFKKINDTYGHNCGDKILKRLVKVTKKAIRKTDVLIRYGGEEFIIILPNTSLKQGLDIAERVRKIVEKEGFIYKTKKIDVTVSMGVAQYIEEQSLSGFINNADQELYQAKESGRNKIVVSN
ncbi:GGDEF domain-containing protein [Oceanobacillus damuensis]|uniref:GGDEF domain-containing protein n=1 Tax=Oceanobacillus damuensis TaxID=937928 RepID=UPI000830C6E3|nr:GGDEF domain-containing protein [Oceanobacillus damuensis]